MHKSRLAGFIIDSPADPEIAATFWSRALGMPTRARHQNSYVPLDAAPRDFDVEVQHVNHAARVHLDIETDNVEAEVARLEALGAKRVEQRKTWWVMEAPTGQRFCVVRNFSKGFDAGLGVNEWT
jgi:hypothetical protein